MKTRRSTSGGCLFYGNHLLQHWSRTQQSVSLSSAEAELNALNKGGTEGLGVRNLIEQCGESLLLELRTDASAARGILERSGAGKVKHLSVKQLWAQDKIARGELSIVKVPREINCSDLLTHHWTFVEGEKFLPSMCVERLAAPLAQRGEGACLESGRTDALYIEFRVVCVVIEYCAHLRL